LRPSDYYTIFAPEQRMPEHLSRAEGLLEARSPAQLAEAAKIRREYPGAASAAALRTHDKQAGGGCPAEWFAPRKCPGSLPDINWCQLDLTRESRVSGTDVKNADATACADIGSVAFSLRAASKLSSNTLQQGFF